MLKKAAFREKRILIIQAEYGHYYSLKLLNDNIRFSRDNEVINQVSCHLVFAVFIIGEMNLTTALLKKLNSLGISVFLLNHNLSVKAALPSESEGNYLLRSKQYTAKNSLEIAINLVSNKIISQELILQRNKKVYDKNVFKHAHKQLKTTKDNQQLLGIEGNVSKTYFQTLFKDIGWYRRAPQTKEDIPNLLLDIGYTYLFNYCDALLRLFGFDTYKGYYHQLFFQRKSLVCDVMEPMRPLIDHQLLKSFNLKQIKENDFLFKNGRFDFKGGYKDSKKYSSIFVESITRNKEDIYNFIQQFYRFCMDRNKYQFPEFKP